MVIYIIFLPTTDHKIVSSPKSSKVLIPKALPDYCMAREKKITVIAGVSGINILFTPENCMKLQVIVTRRLFENFYVTTEN